MIKKQSTSKVSPKLPSILASRKSLERNKNTESEYDHELSGTDAEEYIENV